MYLLLLHQKIFVDTLSAVCLLFSSRGGISVVTESRRRTSNLLVSKVNKKDAGNYTCVPSNARADSVMVHVIDGMFTMYKEKNGRYYRIWN